MSPSGSFDEAIDRLTDDRSPTAFLAGLSDEDQELIRMAQLLQGSVEQAPDGAFVERLHNQVFPSTRRISRRSAFLSGLGALAAGIVGGIGLDRAVRTPGTAERQPPLVGSNGRWIPVAHVAEVPHGAVRSFTAGAVQGFVTNRNGNLRAMSRICTHMGCVLNFASTEQSFVCPCHGAEFDLHGRHNYSGTRYGVELPRLPEIKVRVHGESIEVWSV